MTNIFEGLQTNDLKDLVIPMISIDEFESKVSDEAIVIGFYVTDKAPASDLNKFLQKSVIDILDVDTSPVSDENGFFMVFVELTRDGNVPEEIIKLCSSLKNLTSIENWTFKAYHVDEILPLTKENIEKTVKLHSINESLIKNFLKESNASHLSINGNFVEINKTKGIIVDFGNNDEVIARNEQFLEGLKRNNYIQENHGFGMKEISMTSELGFAYGWDVRISFPYALYTRGNDSLLIKRVPNL